jgi:hypothetical protein
VDRAWQSESAALHARAFFTPLKQKLLLPLGVVVQPELHAASWPCESGGAKRNKNKRARTHMATVDEFVLVQRRKARKLSAHAFQLDGK